MKVQAFSVLVGNTSCNGRCPYCVAKMTPLQGMSQKLPEINERNFKIGCRFAKDSGVSTALLTGKGEPTLFPDQVSGFLDHLRLYCFPFMELQTNGILLWQRKKKYEKHLRDWYGYGLTTVAVSIAHYEKEKNWEIFQPNGKYMNLVGLISHLHSIGFSVRLSCTMFKGGIDTVPEVKKLIAFAKKNKVEQLTITPVRAPQKSENPKVAQWVAEHELDETMQWAMKESLDSSGKKLLTLAHGATVYDVDGQNICLSDCLTIKPSPEEVRQLIFFPDGHLRYDWQYSGAILM